MLFMTHDTRSVLFCVYVVVQCYPCFKFYFPLFQTHYHTLTLPKNNRKIKFEQRKKLNHKIYMQLQMDTSRREVYKSTAPVIYTAKRNLGLVTNSGKKPGK